MGVENLNEVSGNGDENVEALEPQHSVGDSQPATDPADDFTPPAETPENHDDVDVALQDGKDTADGKGDDEVPEDDFQGYTDPAADKQEDNS